MTKLESLPNCWSTSTLSEITISLGGGTPSKSDSAYWTDGTIPWVSPKDMKVFDLYGSEDLVSQKALSKISLAPKGSVLVVVRSGILSRILPVAITHVPVTINQDMRAFVPRPGINARFLALQLIAKEREILASCSKYGTTVASIESTTLSRIQLSIPPENEQHRIVAKIEELFSELDNGIESLKSAQVQLQVYRQALLKYAFEGKLTAQWRADNLNKLETADALLKRIQQERAQRYQQQLVEWEAGGKQGSKPKAPKLLPSLTAEELAELPELPTGWAYTYLAEVGDLGRGKSKHRPRNDPRLFGGNYPFLQTGEVKAANRIIRKYSNTYSDFGLQQSKLWPTGTLCITIAANIAETAFLGFNACFPDSVVGFSAFKKIILAEYVDFFIQGVRSRIEAYAPATAQKNINLETLENLVIPYCGLDEQRQILDILEERFSVIDQLDQTIITSLQQAEVLRQSILKKAFSGQLVPQDPNDEPASILLERIKSEKAAPTKPTTPAKARKNRKS